MEKIVTGIRDADLVVADLTAANPNVMYELGVAHALGKPTIMIAQSVLAVPFDVRAYPVHEYSTHFARAAELASTLSELAESHRAGLLLFSNPVIDFIPELVTSCASTREADTVYTIENCVRDITVATGGVRRFGRLYEDASHRFTHDLAAAIPQIGIVAAREPVAEKNCAIAAVANIIRTHAQALDALRAPLRDEWESYARAMLWLSAPPQLVQLGSDQRTFFATEARDIDVLLNGMIGNIAEVRAANDRTPTLTGNLTHAVDEAHVAQTSLLNEIMTSKAYLARIVSAFERGIAAESA